MQINHNIVLLVYIGICVFYLVGGYFIGKEDAERNLATKLEEQTERGKFFESEVDRLSALVPLHGKDGKFVKKGKNND